MLPIKSAIKLYYINSNGIWKDIMDMKSKKKTESFSVCCYCWNIVISPLESKKLCNSKSELFKYFPTCGKASINKTVDDKSQCVMLVFFSFIHI